MGIAAQFNPENRPPFSSMDRKARRRQDAGIAVYPDDKDSKDETSGTVLKLKSEVQGEHDITVTFTSNEAITRMDGVFRTDSTIGWRILYYASTGIKGDY